MMSAGHIYSLGILNDEACLVQGVRQTRHGPLCLIRDRVIDGRLYLLVSHPEQSLSVVQHAHTHLVLTNQNREITVLTNRRPVLIVLTYWGSAWLAEGRMTA